MSWGRKRGDAFCRSACIPLLMCGVEMDRLRCHDFPWGYGNCVIMEEGAECPSAVVHGHKVPFHDVVIQKNGKLTE